MTLILFAGILIAQLLGTLFWTQQIERAERTRLMEVASNMGARIGQTIQFFSRLPHRYRHVVLDQLRDMGGTRFFVSVNERPLELTEVADNEYTRLVRSELKDTIEAQLGPQASLTIKFVPFSQLRILSGGNRMVDLPPKWKRFALLDPGDRSPVVVVQLAVERTQWMYLASVFPGGEILLERPWLSTERLLSIGFVSLTVLLLTVLLIRWVVRPLRVLARQADALGRGQAPRTLAEQGTREMRSTIRAFNEMGQRIHRYIADREKLFASMSHDLKTPLTRARLRAELIDKDDARDALIGDLDNLDTMVKGALQMVKEGAIHENSVEIDLRALLGRCVDNAQVAGISSEVKVPEVFTLEGRPLSLERLFTNLVDNAIHYGRGVEVAGHLTDDTLIVQVMDRGPGISDTLKNKVFEPYYRVNHESTSVHVGLGLGIVRDIATLHGATVVLIDRLGGGLNVEVRFPLSHFVTKRQAM